ncbi:DUF2911 domain-containing protein [uncultured Psychroserpens sp.]|uniref:DUF2911 domain-containing protein n=1 Tax=uncultured Psychroserpens sp. TaxID=255436 RepID=UPI00260D0550|nr:DUF2911 domain-containing protein [uncultured Psychroserpens sp.]
MTAKKVYFVFFLIISQFAFSQWESRDIITNDNITYPETSKLAKISQTIGITEIDIKYHRPAVRNRQIFGNLIPYGKVWRAGANESTTIKFQDDVIINGNKLKRGVYGIHMIPNKTEWTIIFSNNHVQWGSFYYDQNEDALRIQVKPEEHAHIEYLKYDFENLKDNSLNIALLWASTKVSFKIEVDEINSTLDVIKDELRTLPRFSWRGNREAALYCWLHNTHLDLALELINRSISYERRFENMYQKALILASTGKGNESSILMEEALKLGNENMFLYVGREALGHHNSPKKAIELFKITLKYFPESYKAKMLIGNAHGWMGEKEMAIKAFNEALLLTKNEKEKTNVMSYLNRYKN